MNLAIFTVIDVCQKAARVLRIKSVLDSFGTLRTEGDVATVQNCVLAWSSASSKAR